jgi:hypothetical protein
MSIVMSIVIDISVVFWWWRRRGAVHNHWTVPD